MANASSSAGSKASLPELTLRGIIIGGGEDEGNQATDYDAAQSQLGQGGLGTCGG